LTWFLEKCFPFILGGKQFLKVVKNLEISYYLLIISNLVLKLLIAIYILFWIFDFQFYPLEFNFYINFGLYFYNCYLLFPYYFLIEIFYLSNLVLILLIVTYCCYPIFDPCFDKFSEKFKNSEKHWKSKKYVFNTFASFFSIFSIVSKEFKFSKTFGTRSTFNALFLKSLIFFIESTLILLDFKKIQKN